MGGLIAFRRTTSAVLLVAIGLTGGCASESDPPSGDSGHGVVDGAVPEFSGPYAVQFDQIYRETSSDFARGVLEDEVITDAEHAEMVHGLTDCLAGKGIEFQGYNPDGGFTTSVAPDPEETHDLVAECSRSSGEDAVGPLYDMIRVNPQNLDSATVVADCLVRAGVVPQGYDAEALNRDNEGRFVDFGALPSDLQAALRSCSADPLDLLDQQ